MTKNFNGQPITPTDDHHKLSFATFRKKSERYSDLIQSSKMKTLPKIVNGLPLNISAKGSILDICKDCDYFLSMLKIFLVYALYL